MAVLSNTGTVTPLVGVETTVATIAPGGPLDNVTVYVQGGTGGGGGQLEYALYTEVGGFQTRVAQARVMGSSTATIVDWDTGIGVLGGGSGGAGQTELIDAGGTSYTVTVIDLSRVASQIARTPVTVTIAGVDAFDTAANQNTGQTFVLLPSATGTLTAFNGYAQFMDVAIDQSNLPPVTVTVTASCGGASVVAIVESVNMTGKNNDIASVFRQLRLPVATQYLVSVTNDSGGQLSVTLTGVTYSVSFTSGGSIILGGDVIGPSGANTDVGWSNILLNRAGAGSFAGPVDAAIPIYNAGLNKWFALAISGGATMTDAGVVTINPSTVITLGGDVTGPSNANTVVKWQNVSLLAGAAPGFSAPSDGAIAIYDLGANEWRTFVLSGDATMTNAGVVTVTGAGVTLGGDVTGPAGANTVIKWDNVPLLTGAVANSFDLGELTDAAIPIYDSATGHWRQFVLSGDATMTDTGVVTITGAGVTLAGNANGPAGTNSVETFGIESVNASVTAAQFVPITAGIWYVGISGLTGNITVTLPDTMPSGSQVIVKDEDGSLGGGFTITVEGSTGKTIDGNATYVMGVPIPGIKGSSTFLMNFKTPTEWAVI